MTFSFLLLLIFLVFFAMIIESKGNCKNKIKIPLLVKCMSSKTCGLVCFELRYGAVLLERAGDTGFADSR